MRFIVYIFELLSIVTGGVFRRISSGAKRSTWSLSTELSQKTMRKTIDHSLDWGMEWYRNLQEMSSRSFKNDKTIDSEKEVLNGVKVEWFRPEEPVSTQVIIYFHGGGYVYGSTDTHRPFINRLVKEAKTIVVSVAYRLAPEHPFPTAHNDAFSVYEAIIGEKGYDAKQIILMGDSAGAALCTGILLKLKEEKELMPKSAVLISPWVEPKATGGSIIENDAFDIGGQDFLLDCADKYLQGADEKNPLVAPIYADLSGLPPMLIQVGKAEILLTQVQKLKNKALEDSIDLTYTEYEDMFHTFIISTPNIPQSKAALEEIVAFSRL